MLRLKLSQSVILKGFCAGIILFTTLTMASVSRGDDDMNDNSSDDEPTVARELSGFDPNLTAAYQVQPAAAREADAENRALDRALDEKVKRVWARQ